MRIIIPMAGRGSRMRPHTLTIPKPLLPIAGKPIVERLVEGIIGTLEEPVEEIVFIIGPTFGETIEKQLLEIASKHNSVGRIAYQEVALGTAHAILCAEDSLDGNLIVAFADTLFTADFKIDPDKDGVIWVKQVEDPRAFGVIKMDSDGIITDFVEKPQEFVSDLAIIGIYYFKDGAYLRREMQHLIDHDIKEKGEYQLTNALENMKNKGSKFLPGEVGEWMDCGNKNATVDTNQRILELNRDVDLVSKTATIENSTILPPCFIGDNVMIENGVIGPYVSIGNNSTVRNVVISNSIIQEDSVIENRIMDNSMIGNHVQFIGKKEELSIGDYTTQG